jgi:hypothetical protein
LRSWGAEEWVALLWPLAILTAALGCVIYAALA